MDSAPYKPTLNCHDVVGDYSKCCISCHDDMDEGWVNNFDDCYEDSRVNQEMCCKVETIWKGLSSEKQKEIVDRKVGGENGGGM